MNKSRYLVTNSSEIVGWKIRDYLGVVSTHIVTGTGFLSDFAAGITDFFGGRSGSYERQLSQIEEDAIENLIKKAKTLGGNAIIGLRIDHDEISGKSMQMFMVTVYGTAVIAAKEIESQEIVVDSLIDHASLEDEMKKIELIKKTSTVPFSLSSAEWEYAMSKNVDSISDNLIKNIVHSHKSKSYLEDKDKYDKYFSEVANEYASKYIYTVIANDVDSFYALRELITLGRLGNYDYAHEFLKSDKTDKQKIGLLILEVKKIAYSSKDVATLKSVMSMIENKFPVIVEYVEEKAVMSSKLKRKWICKCGQKNEESVSRCSSCTADIYGFKIDELFLPSLKEQLATTIEALESIYST